MTDLTPREIVSELDRFIIGQDDASDPSIVPLQFGYLSLDHLQARLCDHPLLHAPLVQEAIHLGARRAHGESLAGIQVLELDAGGVGTEGHLATQCIDLTDQVSLALPTDGWVTGHPRDSAGE